MSCRRRFQLLLMEGHLVALEFGRMQMPRRDGPMSDYVLERLFNGSAGAAGFK